MKQQKSQSGFTHLMIITIILAVAVIGIVGYVVWQNLSKTTTKASNATTTSKTTTTNPSSTTNSTSTPNTGYLVLSDWGVKFKLPANLGNNQITYYGPQTSDGSFWFSTSRVEALGGRCSSSAGFSGLGDFMPLGIISRSQTKAEYYTSETLIGEIGGYYYVASPSQANCSETSTDIQSADTTTVQNLLMSVQAE